MNRLDLSPALSIPRTLHTVVAGLFAVSLIAPLAASAAIFPSASTGDIWFQVDHAGFVGEDGSPIEEYYLRVQNNQLQFEEDERDGVVVYQGSAFVSLKFRDEDGDELGEASEHYEFEVDNEAWATSSDRVQLLLLREPLHPRTVDVEVQLEDMNARKRGLVYLVTKKRKNGKTRASLIHPPFVGQEFGLSDIQFTWDVQPAGEDALFQKRNFNVIPNPGRSYGLYRDTLQVYYEVYDASPGSGTYFAQQQIVDDQGQVLLSHADTVAAPSGQWVHTPEFVVKDLPAGTFDMIVNVAEFGSDRVTSASRSFNVVWTEGSWGRSEEDVLEEARVLLTESEYNRFKDMQIGDRETHLAGFWGSQDPSPNTARNELRELFLARVDFANRNYSTSFDNGLVSDRGRIFVRYGQPDEVTREVLPQMGSTLSDVLAGTDNDRPELSQLRTGNANQVDTRPFEIWSYTQQGEPLFPERETITSSTGLTFIFVDEQGIGNYTLRYSSSYKRY